MASRQIFHLWIICGPFLQIFPFIVLIVFLCKILVQPLFVFELAIIWVEYLMAFERLVAVLLQQVVSWPQQVIILFEGFELLVCQLALIFLAHQQTCHQSQS